MARKRTTPQETQTQTGGTKVAGNIAFEEVSADRIDEILAKRRDKGHYDAALDQFVEANIRVGKVPNGADDAGPFAGKKATSIKTSFNAALQREKNVEKGYKELVSVVVDGDDVYLVRNQAS